MPGRGRALTPLAEALETARTIAERFRRANPGAEDRRGDLLRRPRERSARRQATIAEAIAAGERGELLVVAAEQCRHIAAQFAGRVEPHCINLDEYEAYPLMRELAEAARGRYFPLSAVVAKIL